MHGPFDEEEDDQLLVTAGLVGSLGWPGFIQTLWSDDESTESH